MRRFGVSNRILLLLCLMHMILYVDRVNISTAAPLIKANLGLSNTQLGLAFSAFAFPYALFQLIGGYLGDKVGARLILCLSGLIVCMSTAATGLVDSLASLVAARVALGHRAKARPSPQRRAPCRYGFAERNWGFAQGITHTFARIGNAVTPPLIAFLIELVSWRFSFAVLALASLAWLLLWTWYYRNVRMSTPLKEEFASPPVRSRASVKEPVPWLKLFRQMLPVTSVDFCYGWTLWLFVSWIPSFFYQNYHQDLRRSAFYSAGVFAGGVIGDTLGGVISDGILQQTGDQVAARRNMIVLGMLGCFLLLLPMMLVHDINIAALSLATAFSSLS